MKINTRGVIRLLLDILVVYLLMSFIANSINPSDWRTWERVIVGLSTVGVIRHHIDNNRIKIL
jgi:uncharacterized protein YggT (Ycf19 family)